MLTIIEGSFIGGQLSRRGQLKQLQIKISGNSAEGQADRVQEIKVPKTLRPMLGQLLTLSNYLKLQVQAGHHHLKVVSILNEPGNYQPHKTTRYTPSIRVQVCSKGSCHKRGSDKMCAALQEVIQERNLQGVVSIEKVSCLHECKNSPNVRLKPSGVICHKASSPKVFELLEPMLAS
jgi:(2Fe-2S) ferredoxin